MKNTKRILEVKIVRQVDTDPDFSYLGEYSTKPDSDFSIDRAVDEFQGLIDSGLSTLEHAMDQIQSLIDEEEDETDAEYLSQAYDILNDIAHDEPFKAEWSNHRECRYFNPNADNYQGEPAEDIRTYCRQDYKRAEEYNRGYWCYLGIYAIAEVIVEGDVVQDIRSGGLWGVESDCDEHVEEVQKDELADLRTQLKALGFSARAISVAFKNVKEESR